MTRAEILRQSWRAWLSGDERRLGPWWISVAWTAVFATLCAVGFTIISAASGGDQATSPVAWLLWFRANLVISLIVTLTIRILFALSSLAIGRDRIAGWNSARRSLYFSLVPIVGVSIAWPIAALWVLGVDVRREFSLDRPGPIVASIGLGLLVTAVFVQFFSTKARQIQAENRASEAQLRLLQGQMQPHFLFNTLANVVSLMDNDVPRAKRMLESFVDYLRASLPGYGDEQHTLADEVALLEAYLRIIQIRMEDRLRYRIDIAEALGGVALLPLTLQPLVENAVVHGLEPRIEGGSIRISGRREGRALVLVVEDDGNGRFDGAGSPGTIPSRRSGAGTALANLRDRLHHAYGAAASLELAAVMPHGTRARLVIPEQPLLGSRAVRHGAPPQLQPGSAPP